MPHASSRPMPIIITIQTHRPSRGGPRRVASWCPAFAAAYPSYPKRKLYIAGYAQMRKKSVVLKHVTDLTRLGRFIGHVPLAKDHCPRGRRDEAGNDI